MNMDPELPCIKATCVQGRTPCCSGDLQELRFASQGPPYLHDSAVCLCCVLSPLQSVCYRSPYSESKFPSWWSCKHSASSASSVISVIHTGEVPFHRVLGETGLAYDIL